MSKRNSSAGPGRPLISLRDAGQLAGVSPKTIRRWVNAGFLDGFQVGPRLIKVDRNQVLAQVRPLAPRDAANLAGNAHFGGLGNVELSGGAA
ncbi:helix-turn-helix domain-containing protein [Nocardia sp. alder85J]|uniref:helix-turn-helix domain-containing protein n=1 Tax=Nocardia sp. alder85J TaxID=2862949 RepID=UPI001CD4786D|nr:helix-turn-helix domain-containing protein [Nocardia sp. alder85J]MCX4094842.1 helix-turn-helix domain-containing protein [Nocardia sp. alder85J]